MNPESIDIWREYVRMELGFIESLRRRWDVLGISLVDAADTRTDKGKGRVVDLVDPSEHIEFGGLSDVAGSEGQGQEDARGATGTPNGQKQTETEYGGMDGEEGAAARRQIMQGGIVKSVMTSAAEGKRVVCVWCLNPGGLGFHAVFLWAYGF